MTGKQIAEQYVKKASDAVQDVICLLEQAQSEQGLPMLQSRWDNINESVFGGSFLLSPPTIQILAGMSGSGKSYFLNMLHQDFLNPKINPGILLVPIHFGYEMSLALELIRDLIGKTNLSYRELMGINSRLNKEQWVKVDQALQVFRETKKTMLYIEKRLTSVQMYDTIMYLKQGIIKKHPTAQILVSCDHYLLAKRQEFENDMDAVKNLFDMAIDLKHEGISSIWLGQLNDRIDSQHRIDEPTQHYPKKQDLYGAKSSYHAADGVTIIHRPELLEITAYGKNAMPTNGRIFFHPIKHRNGNSKEAMMKVAFDKGTLIREKVNALSKL